MRPRKADVTAVAELLSAGAESPEDLASEVIKALHDLWYQRDSWVVVTRAYGLQWAYGPWTTEHQAKKAIERGIGRSVEGQQAMVLRVVSPVEIETTLAEKDEVKAGRCSTCGHPSEAHSWPKFGHAGCVVGYRTRSACDCTGSGK